MRSYIEEAVLPKSPLHFQRKDPEAIYWGDWDAHWYRGKGTASYKEDIGVPHVWRDKHRQLQVSYIVPCLGEHCTGVLVQRYGVGGNAARELFCPSHMSRWFDLHASKEAPAFARNVDLLMQEAKIPQHYSHYSLESWPGVEPDRKQQVVLARCSMWARQTPLESSLLLLGDFGTGKTALAVGILKERIGRYGDRGLFVTSAQYLDYIRERDGRGDQFRNHATTVRVAVIDDLGAEYSDSDWATAELWKLIDSRYTHRLPTVITSNYPIRELWPAGEPHPTNEDGSSVVWLEERIGTRTVQRLVDREVYRVINVIGPNLRLL